MAKEEQAQHTTEQPSELKQFQRVAVVARHHTDSILDSVLKVEAVLLAAGIDVVIDAETAEVLPSGAHKVAPKSDLETMDLVVVVGGDGSLLGYGRDLAASGVPVVGVNRGGLGFLAAVSPDQIEASFADILAGDFAIEDHFLLQATVTRKGQTIALQTALNDVVVNPGSPARMMEFALWVDGEYVYDQRSDGLIIASPPDPQRIPVCRRANYASRPGCHRDCAHVSPHADFQALSGARGESTATAFVGCRGR